MRSTVSASTWTVRRIRCYGHLGRRCCTPPSDLVTAVLNPQTRERIGTTKYPLSSSCVSSLSSLDDEVTKRIASSNTANQDINETNSHNRNDILGTYISIVPSLPRIDHEKDHYSTNDYPHRHADFAHLSAADRYENGKWQHSRRIFDTNDDERLASFQQQDGPSGSGLSFRRHECPQHRRHQQQQQQSSIPYRNNTMRYSILQMNSPYQQRYQSHHHQQQQQQVRCMSILPEAFQTISIWGGSGWLLKTIHADGVVPYWACFSIISIGVRMLLFPMVLYGAQTSSRFAKVVPEVQFLLTLFQKDLQHLRNEKASLARRIGLMRTNFGTLGGIYKLHKIHPFAVFLSPLLQLPIFVYISVDLRKIVNGLDPMLAQQLVDSSVGWVTDLTEPDPWYGLPILAGVMMYANMEVALGRKTLSGPAASKSDTAVLLKDVFQSFSVFMPCFTSHLPAGVQIYVVTSFMFTIVQSTLLRTETFRQMVGLPSLLAPPPTATYAQQFVELKQLEQKAKELRGDGPVLGRGVLAAGLEASFAGKYRKSTIEGSGITHTDTAASLALDSKIDGSKAASTISRRVTSARNPSMPFIPGISAPQWQLDEQEKEFQSIAVESKLVSSESMQHSSATRQQQQDATTREYMPQFSDEIMEKANRGERPVETRFVDKEDLITSSDVGKRPVSIKSLARQGGKKKPASGRKKRR